MKQMKMGIPGDNKSPPQSAMNSTSTDNKPDQTKEMLKFKVGTNWTGNNISTLLSWISISAYNIECLELAIDESRAVLRRNTIFALFVSTLAGTLNITQFNLIPQEYVNIVIKILLSLLTFSVAINAGRIKIYQYQEALEDYIKIKQEWISFVVQISTELQLPIHLRRDALYLIETYKDKYLDLLKFECEISNQIKLKIKTKMENDIRDGLKIKSSNLHPALMSKSGIKISEIVFDIAKIEGLNLLIAEKDRSYKPNQEINNIYDKITTKVVLNKNKRMNDAFTFIEEKYLEMLNTNEPIVIDKKKTKNGIQMEFLEGSRVNTDVSDFSVGDPNSPKKDDIGSGDILMSALKQTLQSQNKSTSSSKTSTEITYAPHEDEIKDQVINQVYLPETNPSLKRKISFGGILTKLKNKEKEKQESDDDLEMGCRVKTLDS
jgi:hypothetical protein